MRRYETFLDKHCGQPFANIEEDANGGLVMYEEAQTEIDRLKAENAELANALLYITNTCPPIDWVGQDAVRLANAILRKRSRS